MIYCKAELASNPFQFVFLRKIIQILVCVCRSSEVHLMSKKYRIRLNWIFIPVLSLFASVQHSRHKRAPFFLVLCILHEDFQESECVPKVGMWLVLKPKSVDSFAVL